MKPRTVATCQECGAVSPRWVGRCGECGQWGTVVEEPVGRARGPAGPGPQPLPELRPLASHAGRVDARVSTGLDEVDRVLGGGLVRGSVVLLAGEPGVGKSTLALQVASRLADVSDVVIVCGEESPEQIRARADRLGDVPDRISTTQDVSLPSVLAAIDAQAGADRPKVLAQRPRMLIVDSIQTVYDPDISSAPGSVAQVRECGAQLARLARERDVTVVLIGHVTKDGTIAGPRVLEHLVDVVCTFDGDRHAGLRVLRAAKNRFGSTHEVGFFDMRHTGLVGIRDASLYLLQDRCPGLEGSVLAGAVEGRRPFVLEIQALVAPTSLSMPRRTAIGVDPARLPLLVAVLERRLSARLSTQDIYVSAVGGIRVAEPAIDLPVALALLSAMRRVPLPDDLVVFGEVGLAGEIRQVVGSERRLAEARAVGCRVAAVPHGYEGPDEGLELIRLRHLSDAAGLVESPPSIVSRPAPGARRKRES